MPDPVKERPHLPLTKTRDPEVRTWGNALIRVLANMFMEIGQRLNGSIHKDGEIAMEAPFVLGTFTMADLPAASDWPWSIVVVTDGAGGRHFRGSDGTEWLVLDSFDPVLGNGRTPVFADFTCYVNGTTGSDSYDGTSATDDGDGVGPFATIQKAVDTIASLDLQIYDAYIQVADGTYPDAIVLKTLVGAGICYIQGNQTNPENVVIDQTSGTAIDGEFAGRYDISGVDLTASQYCFWIRGFNSVLYYSNIRFGTAILHIVCSSSNVICVGSYEIYGNSNAHIFTVENGVFRYNGQFIIDVTLTGTPNFNNGFLVMDRAGYSFLHSNTTFLGAATGPRFEISQNSTVAGNGIPSNPTFEEFPGDEDGVLESSSTYGGVTVIDASGNNADGYYERDENGKLECWMGDLTLSYVNSFSCEGVWEFPTEFTDTNYHVDAILQSRSATPTLTEMGHITATSKTTSQVTIAIRRIQGMTDFQPGDEVYVGVGAVGRYK